MYSEREIKEFIQKTFGDFYNAGKGNIQTVCPICKKNKGPNYSNKKLAVKIDEESHLTKCWVCGYKSRNLYHLVKKFHYNYANEYVQKFLNKRLIGLNVSHEDYDGNNSVIDLYDAQLDSDIDSESNEELTLPEGFNLLATAPSNNTYSNNIKKYLVENRGIPAEDLDRILWYWKLGYTDFENEEYRGRIILPSFDKAGKVNFYTGRHLSDNRRPKYKNTNKAHKSAIVFNEINIDWSEELTLVEGPFDLIKCNENASCLLGCEASYNNRLIKNIILYQTPVILALDRDAIEKTLKLAKLLYGASVDVKVLDIPREFNDVGEMTQSEFADVIKTAKTYSSSFELEYRLSNII